MAFPVTFYKFSKKENSTAQPTGTEPQMTTFANCILKDTTNILQPTIIIDLGREFNYIPNYAYIPEFERFYYVTGMTWQEGCWHMDMKVDALATWKTEIGQQTLYVSRASNESDGKIIDKAYPTRSEPIISVDSELSPWDSDYTTGYRFVMGVAGDAVEYYAMTYTQLIFFMDNFILNDAYCDAIYGPLWESSYPQLRTEANPLQYIASLKWYPFEIDGAQVTEMKFGWLTIQNFTALKKVVNFAQAKSVILQDIPKHPQASTRGTFLNDSPYSRYRLYFPLFGFMDLDPSIVAQSSDISAVVYTDVRTGKGTIYVNGDLMFLDQLTVEVGVDYQIGHITSAGYGLGQLYSSGLSAIGSIATGNIAGALGNTVDVVGDYMSGKTPSVRTRGSNGGANAMLGDVELQCEFNLLIDEDNTRKGRPLCKIRNIATLGGFIQVDRPDITIPAQEAELKEIREYMGGGFYYE